MSDTDLAWTFWMDECYTIMKERQGARQDVWRRSGARGMAHEVMAKAERLFENLMSDHPNPTEALKEIPDIVNYAIFCGIQVDAANLNGDWKWPKPKCD